MYRGKCIVMFCVSLISTSFYFNLELEEELEGFWHRCEEVGTIGLFWLGTVYDFKFFLKDWNTPEEEVRQDIRQVCLYAALLIVF